MSTNKQNTSQSKIDKALGITDNMDVGASGVLDEELQKKKLEDRKELVKNEKSSLNNLKKISNKDSDFIREMLKNLATTGATMVKVMEEEMQLDPRARSAETAAELINSVTSTLDKLHSLTQHEDKMDIEKQKLEIKKNVGNVPTLTANIVAAGSISDLLKSFKNNGIEVGMVDMQEKPMKTIEAEAEVKKE